MWHSMQTHLPVFVQDLGMKVEINDFGHGAVLVSILSIYLCLMCYKDPHQKTEDFLSCPFPTPQEDYSTPFNCQEVT